MTSHQARRVNLALLAALIVAPPAVAQSQLPGAPDSARVSAGRYQVDTDHTQVLWMVNHMGISQLTGAIAASGGTLELNPSKPAEAKVTVTFNIADMSTTVPDFTKHLLSADFFEVEKHPTATFTSTSVETKGQKAKITGNLMIKGVTKPVTLEAKFFGAGANPGKKLEVGFSATTQIKRSDFGLGFGVLSVTPDEVDLRIAAAFTRADQ
jgi:polyisoprenoid-binding protein YceI